MPTVLNILLNKPLGITAKDVPTLRLMTCSTAPLTLEQWLRLEEMYRTSCCRCTACRRPAGCAAIGTMPTRWGAGLPALRQELAIVDGQASHAHLRSRARSPPAARACAVGYLLTTGSIEPIRGGTLKSGDLAIMDEDGFIRVTGRTKDLIIRGGVNIAPLEIDEVLLKHPGVLDAAAVGVPDPIYGEEVVCFVVRGRQQA